MGSLGEFDIDHESYWRHDLLERHAHLELLAGGEFSPHLIIKLISNVFKSCIPILYLSFPFLSVPFRSVPFPVEVILKLREKVNTNHKEKEKTKDLKLQLKFT